MEHYYSEHQKSPFILHQVEYTINNLDFEFTTAPGTFSFKEIDKGSELLLKNAIIQDGWRILDLGCGYGFIGIALAKLYPHNFVVMTDINKRACRLAKMNIESNNIINAEVRHSNLFSAVPEKFDAILINPPQSAGMELCFKMIEYSFKFLKGGGLLQLVARHNTGGSRLEKKIHEVFGNVKDIAKKGGFRVYVGKK